MGSPPKSKKKKRLFKNPQWQICYEQFLASIPSTSCRKLYDCLLRLFFANGSSPDKYTRADVENFLAAPTMGITRPGCEPRPATSNNRLRVLSSFYNWCGRYRVLYRGQLRPILRGDPPTAGIKARKEPLSERDMEDGELERLLSIIDRSTPIGARDYCLLFSLFVTARRLSELTRLRWRDIEPVTFMENGRQRQGWLYHFQGKGHLSIDDCAEWPAACMDALKAYLELCGKWGEMQPDDPLFVALPGGPGVLKDWPDAPIQGQTVDKRFRRYANLAGIPPERVIHSLRHESAWQRHESNGHNLQQVQRDLRHSSIVTTMRYINRRQRRGESDPIANKLAARFGVH